MVWRGVRGVVGRLSGSWLVVVVVFVLVFTGGAFAAGRYLITSERQISPKVLKQLKAELRGAAGVPGVAGVVGPPGPAGARGENGAAGSNGSNGGSGAAGKNGEGVTVAKASGKECAQGGATVANASGSVAVCDGVSGFTEFLPEGQSEHGIFVAQASLPNKGFSESLKAAISFNIPLKNVPVGHFIKSGTPEKEDPEGCSGTVEDPQAAPGNLCVFGNLEERIEPTEPPTFFAPEGNLLPGGVGKAGTVLQIPAEENGARIAGAWVVTAK